MMILTMKVPPATPPETRTVGLSRPCVPLVSTTNVPTTTAMARLAVKTSRIKFFVRLSSPSVSEIRPITLSGRSGGKRRGSSSGDGNSAMIFSYASNLDGD
jgi:hypothetical protein